MVSADSEVRPDPGPTLRPHHRKTSEAGPEHLSTSSLPTLRGLMTTLTVLVAGCISASSAGAGIGPAAVRCRPVADQAARWPAAEIVVGC